MFALMFGLFGLIIGSFLNVVVLRKGVRSLQGRSACMHCGVQIRWFDLVPVFSWIVLRGKCRVCGSRISWQYPLVEAVTGVLFACIGGWVDAMLVMTAATPFLILGYLAIVCVLVVIAVYDFRHTIIPDDWAYLFAVLALVAQFLTVISAGAMVPIAPAVAPVWWEVLVWGPVAAAPLFFLWVVSGGRWMGLGDSKLALGIGWLLGSMGLVAVFGAFVLGAAILVPVMLIVRAVTHSGMYANGARHLTMKSEVPFGPFLIMATILVWILGLYDVPVNLLIL